MKKILALTLAAVMAAGMSTVAFADKGDVHFVNGDGNNYVMVDRNDDGKFEADEDDSDTVLEFAYGSGTLNLDGVKGETTLAIPVYGLNNVPITDKDDLKGWKIKAEWSVGDLDEKAEFEYVKINGAYQYAVVFTLPESAVTKTSDLGGSITIYDKSADLKDPTVGLNKIVFNAEYGYSEEKYDEVLDWDKVEVVNFKGVEGEETMMFGDYLEFEVDVTGQGKLNLKWNTKFDPEFAAYYDYANIDFITFEKEPSFNKIGRVYIYADEDAFIYKKGAEGAEKINGLEWDEDYEAWTFKTRKLESYVISDVELDEKTVTEDKDDTTTDGGKQNPDTGR